jgi:diguanylate cyclase (GGDEF)-like protein/PAS domain S-box-containing protein
MEFWMKDRPLEDFSSFRHEDPSTAFVTLRTDTETIHLDGLFKADLTSSGSFDVKGIRDTVFGKLLESLPIPALVIDESLLIRFCNEAWARFNVSHKQLEGRAFSVLFTDSGSGAAAELLVKDAFRDRRARAKQQSLMIEGKPIWTRTFFRCVRLSNGRAMLCLVEDLTLERKQLVLMETIKRAKNEWERTVDMLPDLVALLDSECRIVRTNKAMAKITGRDIRKVVGQPCYKLIHGTDSPPFFCPFANMGTEGHECSVEYFESRLDAFCSESISPIRNARGHITGYVLGIRDETERKKLEAELHRQATCDDLTSLFNRRQILVLVEAACETAERYDQPLSLCICDIDYFKQINDEYGHEAGDRVLAKFGEIVKTELRGADIAGRYGGDEFIVAFPNTSLEGAIQSLGRVRVRLAQVNPAEGPVSAKLTFSAGFTQLSSRKISATALIREADKALYEAKKNGRDRVVVAKA